MNYFEYYVGKEREVLMFLDNSLTPVERDNFRTWWSEHYATCKSKYIGISLGDGGGIGSNVYVNCSCGEKADITDYLSW